MGMHRLTGQKIDAIPHVYQSIAEIISTPLGTRVMRRDFGSRIPFMVDDNITPLLIMRIYAEAARSIHQWEPRVLLKRVQLERADHEAGFLQLILTGDIYLNRLTSANSSAVGSRETIEFSVPAVVDSNINTVGFSGAGLLVRPVAEAVAALVTETETTLTLSQAPSADMPIRVHMNGQILNLDSYTVSGSTVVIAEALPLDMHDFECDYFVEVPR